VDELAWRGNREEDAYYESMEKQAVYEACANKEMAN
jgi:hypothetical protein